MPVVDDAESLVATHPQLVPTAHHGTHGVVHQWIDQLRHPLILRAVLHGIEPVALVIGEPEQTFVIGVGEEREGERLGVVSSYGHHLPLVAHERVYLVLVGLISVER